MREWRTPQSPQWQPVRADDVIASMEHDVFPDIGHFRTGDIDAPLLLATLRTGRVSAPRACSNAQRPSSSNVHPDVRASLVPASP